jgi:hypothetical protein
MSKRYQLTVRELPGNWRAPGVVRLRHFLKAMKRAYGIEAVTLREVVEDQRPEDNPNLMAREREAMAKLDISI